MNAQFVPTEGEPTPQQLRAYTSDAPRILAIAGPGSGKTRTLIWRIKRLLHDGVTPDQIAAITFTNAAADEIKGRLGTSVNLHFVGTLHGFMLQILQKHGKLIGYNGKLSVIDEAGADLFLEEQVKANNYKATIESMKAVIAKGPPKNANTPELLFVWNYYQALKRANLITYDAILCLGHQLLSVHQICLAPLKYLFVDEYQDSGKWDHAIYKVIAIPNIFWVADLDQAIYSFRGGDINNVMEIAEDPNTQVIRLQDNFRSGRVICQAAQRLIEHNQKRIEKLTLSALDFDGTIYCTRVADWATEYATISLFLSQKTVMAGGQGMEYLNNVAILLRTNDLVDKFTDRLREEFPVKERRRNKLPEDWRLCTLLLSVLVDPRNDYTALKWLEVKEGASVARKAAVRATAERTSVNTVWMHIPTDITPAQVEGHLSRAGIGLESIHLVRELVNKSAPNATLSDILFAIRCGGFEQEDVGNGLTICTMHAAKGREFEVVILPACERHIIPSERKDLDIEEERRLFYVAITRAKRELVITHAAKRVRKWGSWTAVASEPSPFIKEIEPQ